MKAQPHIGSNNVGPTAIRLGTLLNTQRGNVGDNYEQIRWNNEMVLQTQDEEAGSRLIWTNQ